MTDYVLNKRSKVLHKLPASESCNTDQIDYKLRWTGEDTDDPVAYQDATELVSFRKCRRCFGG
jgi:hypothetical protein